MLIRDARGDWKLFAEEIGPFISNLIPIFDIEKIDVKLSVAGNPFGLTAESFVGAKFVLLALGLIVGSGLSVLGIPVFAILLIGLVFYAVPDLLLKNAFEERQSKIYKDFPGFLSLISTAVSAGIDFDQALLSVSRKFPGPLGDELRMAWKEIATGGARATVLRQTARRTGIDVVERFFETVITARERGGVKLSTMIEIFNGELVESQRRKIQEESQKIPTKMLAPIFACIFLPTIFMIATPVIISLFDIL